MSVVYHFGANANLGNHTLRIWLWVSVAAAVLGAILLYPLGNGFADFLFVLVKAAMVGGLLLLLLKKERKGYPIWAWASAGAVVMTIVKWCITGHLRFLFVLAILVDLVMPAFACTLSKREA